MKKIIILPLEGCRRSRKVLAYLDEQQIPYARIDLASSEGRALAEEYDLRASSGIIVDGSSVNPYDILERPSCRIKTGAARKLFGLDEQP